MPVSSYARDEPRSDGLVEPAVGHEERPAVDRAAAVEVRRPAAGLLDEDQRRRGVPGREADLDHRLGGALGDERVAPEVAEPALAPDVARAAPSKPGARPDATMSWPEPYRTWASSSEATRDTWIRRGASPRLRAHAPPPRHAHQRSSSAGADMTDGLELAVALDREQRPEQRHAADEVVGAVDRVDVPADGRVAGLGAVLLADEAVVRERVGDPLADAPLDRRVGLGHERPVGLGLDLEVAPEVRRGR